jgi:hypothetical protein
MFACPNCGHGMHFCRFLLFVAKCSFSKLQIPHEGLETKSHPGHHDISKPETTEDSPAVPPRPASLRRRLPERLTFFPRSPIFAHVFVRRPV